MATAGVRGEPVRALDGIRGLAILAVLLFHCSLRLNGVWRVAGSWGWMGVDLFFVVSGFLITGILLDAKESPSRFYYGGFYGRRVLRIAPAFVALMLALVAAPKLTGQNAAAYQLLTSHEAWYWFFLTNVLIVVYGWMAVIPQTAPLWSLAVEEQFYLIWPLVVRHISARGIVRLGIAVIVVAALARVVLAQLGVDIISLYVSTPTRADLLAWGAVLAALVRLPDGIIIIRRLLWPAFIGASLVIVVVVFRFKSSYYWSSTMAIAGYPAIAVSSACLVSLAVIYDPAALRFSWLRAIGRVSYGLYLWHMTGIEIVARLFQNLGGWLIPLAFLVSLVPTLLSWYLVERPALALKRFAPMRPTRKAAALVPSGLMPAGNSSASLMRASVEHRNARSDV